MNKIVSALVVACAGAAAASVLAAWRKNHQLEAKAQQKEALSRWEDDGGPPMSAPAAPTL